MLIFVGFQFELSKHILTHGCGCRGISYCLQVSVLEVLLLVALQESLHMHGVRPV